MSFNDETGAVFVRQDWLYKWLLFVGLKAPWTYAEKARVHRRAEAQIHSIWNTGLTLQVRSKRGPAPRFGSRCPIEFDIRWVTKRGHWTVNMNKMPPRSTPTTFLSEVSYLTRTIHLDTADLILDTNKNEAGVQRSGIPVIAHEFGHTFYSLDEYELRNANIRDADSVMNIGRQVRARHLGLVVHTLNQMMPDFLFKAP